MKIKLILLIISFCYAFGNEDVTFDELKNVSDGKTEHVLIIDVRRKAELEETGVIPNSINIPLANLENELQLSSADFGKKFGCDKPALDSSIIFVCRSGKRSKTAIGIATNLGFTNVKHYPGGWLGWKENLKN